jgi:4-hydroxybenzoyl-CoA thioesterase
VDDRITLRFLATPQDSTFGGAIVSAGSMLEWIDKAGYACAVGWSAGYCVTAYVGNVHFSRPVSAGDLIQAHARIIHTGRTSMQVLVVIETADAQTRRYRRATHCLMVFVAVDENGRPREVPRWQPQTAVDRTLHESAASRLDARREIRDAMLAQPYTDAGTTPGTTFRFLAAPAVTNWGGNAHGGTVMRWIEEVGFAVAVGWARSPDVVAVYSGGIHFFAPVRIGDVVELRARLIHTGPHSMHVAVHVRAGSPTHPDEMRATTQCLAVFVQRDAEGRAAPIPALLLMSDEDRRLDAHAVDLIERRAQLAPLPLP